MEQKDYTLRNDNGRIIFERYTGTDECFRVPEGVTEIAERAFADNKRLKHIDLGDVISVGAFAFQDCSNLETVLMDKAEVISAGAFEFCSSLHTVSIGAVKTIGDMAFRHCRQLDIAEMPRSLTSIGAGTFSHTAIKTARIDWLEEIPRALFSGDTCLTYADISGARIIGETAFAECRSLSVALFGAAESIGSKAFYKCDSFEPAKLPETLKSIGDEAFEKVREELIVPRSVSCFGKNCFGPSDRRKAVCVYESSLYSFSKYFMEEAPDRFDEDEHFHLWESSIDVTVLDDSDKQTGYLPLFTDLDHQLTEKMIDAFKADNSFDYRFIDAELFPGLRWNRRCMDDIVFKRLKNPYDLEEDARRQYSDYLKSHLMRLAKSAVSNNDIDELVILFDNCVVEQEETRDILDYSISKAANDCTAFLLERSSEMQSPSDFLIDEL